MLVALSWVELALLIGIVIAGLFWLVLILRRTRPSGNLEAVEGPPEVTESEIACPTCGMLFVGTAELEAHLAQHHLPTV
jgi:hypothetical protein